MRAIARGGLRADAGKAVMVCLAAAIVLADMSALLSRAVPVTAAGALRAVDALLTCACYALILWGYLRRGRPVASSGLSVASVVAVIATFTPFPFPLLDGAPAGAGRQLAADLILAAGASWSAWSLGSLGPNLSVIPQAREIADRGPYRLVRHPLYTGELVSAFGLALAAGSVAAFALWLALVGMQVYRARCEERVLAAALPGYHDYRARTAALVPGLF